MKSILRVTGAVLALVGACLATDAAIPLPDGPWGVACTISELTNLHMADPYAPNKQPRRLMISAFYPVAERSDCQQIEIPYMPPATAAVYDETYASYGLPNGTFEAVQLTLCAPQACGSRKTKRPSYPVAIFSPGLGNSRLLYSNVATSLAAQGYVVITVDHPYDAAVVEFPGGDLVMAANIDDSDVKQIDADVAVRVKDLSFVIDQMQNETFARALLQEIAGTADSTSVLLYGHSVGGAAAAATMQTDHRIRGGINLDGTFFGPVVSKGLDKPFMVFAHQGKNQSTDPSWASIWPRLRNSKVQLSVTGTTHASFLDFPVILDVLGLRAQLPAQEVAEVVGSIMGDRMVEILTAYTASFLQFVLGKSPSPPLARSVAQFPEVTIANSTLVKPK
jgi:dienelactone hydrolase